MNSPTSDSSDWEYRVYSCETRAADLGVFASIVELWNARRAPGRLPAWRDFRFEDFVGWYGWVSVCDVTYEPIFDTRYRLWGTRVAEILGYDMTGRSPRRNSEPPSEYEGGYSQVEFDFLETLARQPAIGVTAGSIDWQGRGHISYEEIILPLSEEGEAVDRLLFVISPKK